MAGLNVYSKDGSTIRCTLTKYQYNGEYMGERTVTSTINSPTKIDWEIGDYIFLRGQYFKIKATPAAKKQSRRNEYGAGIVYDNVTFQSIIDDLVVIQFKDYVIGDNHLHYSGLGTFAFYMQNIDDLSNRVLANLNLAYGEGTWDVIIATEDVYDDNGNILVHGDDEMTIRDQSVSISDGTNLHDALNLYNSMFEINYLVTVIGGVNTIIIGGDTTIDTDSLGYGKGRGLLSLTQSRDESHAIITRLHAYGSTRNMPYRYYNKFYNDITRYSNFFDRDGNYLLEAAYINKLMLPYAKWTVESDVYDAYLDSENLAKYGIREGTVTFDGSDEDWDEIYPSIEGMSIDDIQPGMTGYKSNARLVEQTNYSVMVDWVRERCDLEKEEVEFIFDLLVVQSHDTMYEVPLASQWQIAIQCALSDIVPVSIIRTIEYTGSAYISQGDQHRSYYTYREVENLDGYEISVTNRGYSGAYKYMYSLETESSESGHWVFPWGYIDGTKTVSLQICTQIKASGENIVRCTSPEIVSAAEDYYDFMTETMYNPGTGVWSTWSAEKGIDRNFSYIITQEQIDSVKDYLETIFTDGNTRLDVILETSTVRDNGVEEDVGYGYDTDKVNIEETFDLHIPQLFFNIMDFANTAETPLLCIKSGACAGREFEILDCKQCDDFAEGWIVTLKRDDSDKDSMNMYFPNTTFNINKGDNFVLTGISMPSIYVETAEQRLLTQAQKYLSDYDHEVYQYSPELDNQYLADHPTIANMLQEGLVMTFNDRDAGDDTETAGDLGINEVSRYIKKLTVKYNEGYLPKYEIQLDEDIKAVTLQKVINKQIARRLLEVKS